MHASVVVCTYNRADSLRETLDCLSQQVVNETYDWEVIVVDNNSSDDTREVIEAAAKAFPRIRYEFESKQGLSHARNKGIAMAQGAILLFTDDDVCPQPNWIQILLEGMETQGCDACGGYIAPNWEVPPPSWLTPRFHGFLAIRTDIEDIRPIVDAKDAPYGANMAFRASVFSRVGGFDTKRGRKGSQLASGEDGELFERILDAGMKVMFFGNARVAHRVEAFRLNKNYFRRWRFQNSRNLAEAGLIQGQRTLIGIPLYLFPQLFRSVKNAIVSRFGSPEDEAFFREVLVWHFLGLMRGLISARFSTSVR